MEIVEQYGLDPNVAYTPAINTAAAEAQERLNRDWFLKQGKSPAEAAAMARNNKRKAGY